MKIDIRTRVIPDDHTVVVARPGAKFRLHLEFHERNFVGVELPGLFSAGENISYDDPDIIARIKRSIEIRKWLNGGGYYEQPPMDLAQYDNTGETQSIRQYLRLIRFYLNGVKKGDLILNPPATFNGIVHLGEVSQIPRPTLYQVERYADYPLVGVPVRWIGRLRKQELSSNTLEALKKPTALFSVGADHREKIYSAAYGNFIFKDRITSSFATTSQRYGSLDELVFQAFINSVALNTQHVDRGDGRVVGLGEAAALLLEHGEIALGDYALDLNININSPGVISLISSKITPLVAAALFTLAVTYGADAYDAVMAGMLEIGNSAGEDGDACAAMVREQTYAQIQLLGWDGWVPECERLVRLRNETGLDTRAEPNE